MTEAWLLAAELRGLISTRGAELGREACDTLAEAAAALEDTDRGSQRIPEPSARPPSLLARRLSEAGAPRRRWQRP